MCIYLSSIELEFDRIAGNLQGVRHCCKPPVSVLMRVVVLDCERDRLARFDFAEGNEHFCLEALACCHVWKSRLAFAGGSLALAAKVPPSRSLVERRCPSLSISRTDPRRTRLQYCSKGLLDSRGLSTSWLLALDACGITATLHNGVSSVRMLPNGFLSIGEAGQGRKVS